jgi:hypothetical protein
MEKTDEIVVALEGVSNQVGVDMGVAPEGSEAVDLRPTFPAVSFARPVSVAAHETGMNLRNSGLFRFGRRVGTVADDGNFEDMEVDRFRTWIDRHQICYVKKAKRSEDDDKPARPVQVTLKADVAKVLLASEELLGVLPKLRKIVPVRLPVFDRKDDRRGVRLLPYGYDHETGVYCVDTGIEIAEDWTLEQAVEYLRGLLKDFPFGDPERSISVQLCAMMTCFCQLLFDPMDQFPLIFFNANIPGSGKSRLAELCCYPVYGDADDVTYSESEDFTKALNAWSENSKAYTFIDNLTGFVKNNKLDKWVTLPTWTHRIMHTSKMATSPNQTLTLITGNQATLSDDLGQRSLVVDLWSSEPAADRARRIKDTLDHKWLASGVNRSRMLSAYWALLRHWNMEEEPAFPKVFPRFEAWSRTVPGIVTLAGFADPLAPANLNDAGQKTEVEFVRLLEAAIREWEPAEGKPAVLALPEWCAMARGAGLFHSILGDIPTMRSEMDRKPSLYVQPTDANGMPCELREPHKDAQAAKFMDRGQATKFGNLLHKTFRGQIRTVNGRRYKFADRQARHSTFALELIGPA